MFVTVACGAISGFHATQSPMISKCLAHEKQGRSVFYGAMISEGIIALAWATAGIVFFNSSGSLLSTLQNLGQSGTVYEISKSMLGTVGGILAVIGVVACPITSGDTAFRSARLVLAETFNLKQKKFLNRLVIAIPLFAIGGILTRLNFDVLWRYFSWANQTLAMLALWVFTSYLLKNKKNKFTSLITALPAIFMVAVCVTYILIAPEGLKLSATISYLIGIGCATISLIAYVIILLKFIKQNQKK